MTREEYLSAFTGEKTKQEKQTEALKQALDIRKFEIDLYWKRAAYFWTFIAATFAGYLAIQSSAKPFDVSYLLCCIGTVFSVAWYFVNRGSKQWQRNWEHVMSICLRMK